MPKVKKEGNIESIIPDGTIKTLIIPIDNAIPNEKNPRNITQQKMEKLKKSLTDDPEFLKVNRIVIDENNVVLGGNMRWHACKALAFKEIEVTQVFGWSDKKKQSFIIKDNVGFGEWDWDMLANEWEIDELEDWGLDLPFDFKPDEEETEAADEAPAVQEDPVTVEGDIWELGKHRLMCGNSTNMQHIETLMAGTLADQFVTDPPYNVDYEGKTKDALKIENDSMSNDDFRQFLRDVYTGADAFMKEGAVFYIWHADSEGYNFRGAAFDIGWKVRQCLIWKKQTMVMGRQDYHWQHEPCLYGWKEGAGHLWATDRKQTTILEFDRPMRNDVHPTMKPIDLIKYCVLNNTKGDDIVLDLFACSGTTLMACAVTKRVCHTMELDPRYCDVVVKRYVQYLKDNSLSDVIKLNGKIYTGELLEG